MRRFWRRPSSAARATGSPSRASSPSAWSMCSSTRSPRGPPMGREATAKSNGDTVTSPGDPVLAVFGEIQTCLLPSRHVLDTPASVELLSSVRSGGTVTSRERPVPLVISPGRLEGIDCNLAQYSRARNPGKRVHVIGTVASRTVVIGGRILQGSACTRVVRAPDSDRQLWSYYLTKPGVIEAVSSLGDAPGGPLADGYLRPPADDVLDLTSISTRMSNLT